MTKGPFFITTLEADVRVHPSQMDNNIVDNIKRNLERMYLYKCYYKYGYIDKIFDVSNDIKGGIIRAEDPTSSSVHSVKFNCRICNPLKKSVIMGRIISINNVIIAAENGPIRFIIGGMNDINTSNIQYKGSAFYPVTAKGDIIKKPINVGTYVMIQVMGKRLIQGSERIIVFGRLEYVILDDKVLDEIRNQYAESIEISAENLANDKFDEQPVEMVAEDEGGDEESDD